MSEDENGMTVGNPEMMRILYPAPKPTATIGPVRKTPKPSRFLGFTIPKFQPTKTRTLGAVTIQPRRTGAKRETTVSIRVGGLNRPFIYGFICTTIGLACLGLLAIYGTFDPIFRFFGL